MGGWQVGWEEEDKVKNGKEKEKKGKGTQKDAPAMNEAEAEVLNSTTTYHANCSTILTTHVCVFSLSSNRCYTTWSNIN